MTDPTANLYSRYQPYRHIVEPAAWILFWCGQALTNSRISWLDLLRHGVTADWWEPVAWEWSSCMVLLLLVPVVVRIEARIPLRWVTLRQNLPWHLLISVPFSVVHVLAMVGIRKLVYVCMGRQYTFSNWLHESGYEYLKDIHTYFFILIAVAAYRLLVLRWQGEASLLEEPDVGPAVEPVDRPERFLVRTLGKEFLLPAADIAWIQAWGNYVNLHVRGHDYPLRSTMAAIERRVDPKRFVRVHRSYIVNLDYVVQIEALETGDARATLRDGQHVPVSRNYRDGLKKAASGLP